MNLLTLVNKLAEELGEGLVVDLTIEEARHFTSKGDALERVDDALDKAQGDARQSGIEQFVLIRVRP